MDESSRDDDADLSFDPTRRKLCPDGACVGVIGADGVCSVCGRTEAEAESGEASRSIAAEASGGDEGGQGEAGGFDASRRLCDDGSCVGVVGDDGVCRVCGRRAS
jgi:hypothetical protein